MRERDGARVPAPPVRRDVATETRRHREVHSVGCRCALLGVIVIASEVRNLWPGDPAYSASAMDGHGSAVTTFAALLRNPDARPKAP